MLVRRLTLLSVSGMIITLTGAPAQDKPARDSVTEHFSRARPGTVPRIPASLFLQDHSPSHQERPGGRSETGTESEEVKYFTAYPSLTTPAQATHWRHQANLKDLPTTERIADRVTQPPEKPVLLQQTREISEIPDVDLILSSADEKSGASNSADSLAVSDVQGNDHNISHTVHATQTVDLFQQRPRHFNLTKSEKYSTGSISLNELSERNNIISPDDLRYNQNDPVPYTSNNWEKVTTSSSADKDSDGVVNTVSSSVIAPIENYEDEVDELVSDVSLKEEYNTEPETLLTGIQDAELDDRNMTEISSVFSSSSDSDYHENYHQHLTINDSNDQVNGDFYDYVTPDQLQVTEEENDSVDEADEAEADTVVPSVTTPEPEPDTDQTDVYSEFPITEEVITTSERREYGDGGTATPSTRYDVTTEGELHSYQTSYDVNYEEAEEIIVIDVDDYSEYSVPYDDNNEKDETTQPNNSSLLMQFANIFTEDDSQVYQANETSTNLALAAPSGLPAPTMDNYQDDTETGTETQPDDSAAHHLPPLLTLMHNEQKRLRFLIQPGRLKPDTKVHLMYQRLPASVTAESHHLSAPVIKVFEMLEEREEYEMVDLITGQYLVCAEVRLGNTSLQSDCFKAEVESPVDIPVERLGLELGIIIAICVSGLAFLALASFSVFCLLVRNRRRVRERDFKRKVEELARKERDRNEKFDNSELSVTYPDPNEPFEERCIM